MATELREVIGELRAELTAAMAAGRDEELKFGLGPVELEMTVAVEKSAQAGAKVKFWVVEANGSGKLGSTTTSRIKLTLEPELTGKPGRRPQISGDEMPGER